MERRRRGVPGAERVEDEEVSRSFSGWLSGIITAGPSLLVFSPAPFPPPSLPRFQLASPISLSRFLLSSLPRAPHRSSSYFVSRHCPFQSLRDCGANTARYRINFLSRGCRDFTLLERRHRDGGGRAQSETFSALSLGELDTWDGCGVEVAGVRVKSSREEN